MTNYTRHYNIKYIDISLKCIYRIYIFFYNKGHYVYCRCSLKLPFFNFASEFIKKEKEKEKQAKA